GVPPPEEVRDGARASPRSNGASARARGFDRSVVHGTDCMFRNRARDKSRTEPEPESPVETHRLDRRAPRAPLRPRCSVLVEALAGLAAELAGADHLAEQGGGPELLAELFVEVVEDREADVEADEVAELERAHRVAVAELHRFIDVLRARDAALEHADGFDAEDHAEAAGREAREVFDDDRLLADARRERARRLDGRVGRAQAAHDLEELHQRDRVEEVEPDDPRRVAARRRDLGHAQRRGVGAEDRVLRRVLSEQGEGLDLQLHALGDRLDDQIRVGDRRLELGRGVDARPRRVTIAGAQHVLLDQLGEALVDLRQPPLEEGRLDVAHRDLHPRRRTHLRDAVAHRAGAEHRHLPNLAANVVAHERSCYHSRRRYARPRMTPTFVALAFSPWSIKARWALDHHRVAYRFEPHLPMAGEALLRLRTGRWRGRITVPILLTRDGAVHGSLEIARYAERVGEGARLFPAEHEEAIARWAARADVMLDAGRALAM